MEQDSTAYLQNLETVTRSTIDQREISTLRIPGLTILAHADPSRIGERAALTALASSEEILLSRLDPVFAMPGESRRRALADPHLSRRPLRLIPVPGGGVRLLTKGSKTRVEADGALVDGWREFTAAELELGVVLLLADKVTLLLHALSPALPQVRHFGLVGESDGMVAVRQQIARVADLDVPALLRGETGTGKELVARAIHRESARHSQPFVAVNMGAIPPSLAAAELFGAAKGAFTGADRKRSGYFTRARGGTLFLDEIGETPPEVQVLLLRSLETGVIQPVGSETASKIDVRILAATDAFLEKEIEAGRFRAPLLHRLSGYEIRLPPLRDRRDDIGRLLVHFLRLELEVLGETHRLEAPAGGQRPWLPAPLVARLATHLWPGNVRQLRNVARQLVIDNRGADQLRITEQIEAMLEETAPVPLSHLAALGPVDARADAPATTERAAAEPRAVLKTIVAMTVAGAGNLVAMATARRALNRLLEKHGGQEPESDGPCRLLLFERPLDGLACVTEYHQALAELSRSPEVELGARAGIHLGEVLQRRVPGGEDASTGFEIDPATRSIAVRLSTLATRGRTLLTRSAYDLARQAAAEDPRLAGADVQWSKHGELPLQEDRDDVTAVFEVGAGKPAPPAAKPAAPAAKPAYRAPSEVSEDELLAALRAKGFRLQPTAAALRISRTSLYALIDRSPNVRKARDLSREEIERCRRRHDGDLDAMAAELEVSRKGLSRRMTQLGLG